MGTQRKCDNCGKPYTADERNLKRGWGLTCSKSCTASKREKSKPGYDPRRVELNNRRRENWFENSYHRDEYFVDDDPSWDAHKTH